MATETSRSSSSSADSYIGSLISLTSKSEIRYEGILANINTEESSIGLNHVRSFGTEGRKKDGPQLPGSDKIYEYILFRGSDIKDLQVKSSQPVQQPTQPIHNDPAIIQSHYPRPPPTISSTVGPTTHNLGQQTGSTYQSGLPLYQPGGNLGSWAPSPPPPNPNTTGPTIPPMYWPGYYAAPPPPQLHHQQQQQSLPRPPPSLQYPTFNPPLSTTEPPNTSAPNFPEYPSPLSSTLPPLMHNKPTAPPLPGGGLPLQSVGGPSEPPTPSLVTPGQLLQSVPAVGVSAQSPPAVVHKEVEVVQVVPTSSSPPQPTPPPPQSVPAPVAAESQPPILPLPPQTQMAAKPNGANYQNRHNYNYRGRERGRGSGGSRPVMKFTEEFDFNAMNEKFNKDEVWGSLGKSKKDGNGTDEEESEEENDPNLPKVDVKPVYSKDDFFDSLSSNSLDRQSNYGRTRFSEQMKLDTETFGEFSRYRGGGRGGRGPYRGGRGGRGGGGGYYGRGYGYVGRGRGGRNPNQSSNQGGDY